MKKIDILEDNVLNIFCDASIKHEDNQCTYGLPGSVAIDCNGNTIDYESTVMVDSTNNESEIYAILLATQQCIKYQGYYSRINIFSDSRISVCGVREWMFNWVKNARNDTLMSSSGTVANQQIFLHVVNLILTYLNSYHLYHVDGHMNPKNPKDMLKLIADFKKFNGVYINPSEAIYLSTYNNWVDGETGRELELFNLYSLSRLNSGIIYPIPNRSQMDQFRSILDI